jgi:hypothetical protein
MSYPEKPERPKPSERNNRRQREERHILQGSCNRKQDRVDHRKAPENEPPIGMNSPSDLGPRVHILLTAKHRRNSGPKLIWSQ